MIPIEELIAKVGDDEDVNTNLLELAGLVRFVGHLPDTREGDETIAEVVRVVMTDVATAERVRRS